MHVPFEVEQGDVTAPAAVYLNDEPSFFGSCHGGKIFHYC